MSAEILGKAALTGGAGVLGALVLAAVDPPKTRKELFMHACAAGIGSMVFGPLTVLVVGHFAPFLDVKQIEVAVPVYFVTGALSWSAFSCLAKVRTLIARKGAAFIFKKVNGN